MSTKKSRTRTWLEIAAAVVVLGAVFACSGAWL